MALPRHKLAMRHLVPIAAALLLAACVSTPPPVAAPVREVVVAPHRPSDLNGITANELATRFGLPRLQVREGDGTKLQFAGKACVLDAYLYPPAGGKGLVRVTHVDARDRAGRDVDQARCIADVEAN